MNKQRKTSNILNVFQYDEVTGAVTLPSTLVLTAPDGSDNSTKVPTTAWTRSYVSGLSYLTGNQSITVSGDATGSGTTSINLTLANTAVTPGTYGSTTLVPVVTVDSKGRITNVTTAAISGSLSFTGDVTGTGTTGTSTGLTLANSGVTAGTYTKVTVDSKGRVTVGASATTTDIAEGTRLYYTDARVLAYLGANNYATQSYVTTQINNLVSGAPGLLDTLDELAASLGDDPNFATTTATSLGNRLRVDTAAQGLNGTQQSNGRTNLGLGTAATSAIGDFATAAQGTRADTAHGWGNHASAGYLTSATAATTYASLTGSYANPSWITSLAYSKITGVPAFLTSYTETDTLANVTSRGASTSTAVTFSGGASISNLLINGAPAVTESSLALGAMGATEGGQLTLNRATSHTFAAHLDVWQDTFRILYGTNTATSGVAMGINMSTGRVNLPFYTTSSSFTGTAAGVLAFDSSGNIITIAVPGGAVSSVNAGTGISVNATIGAVTVTNTGTLTVAGTANQVLVNGGSAAANGNITLSLPQSIHTSASPTFNQIITTNNGGSNNVKLGDDAWIGDTNVSNTVGIVGQQNSDRAYISFGSDNTVTLGRIGTGALTWGGNTIYHAGNLTNLNQLTNGPGYLTGITSLQVTNALGFTPYNATNPSGYLTASTVLNAVLTPYTVGANTAVSATDTIETAIEKLQGQVNARLSSITSGNVTTALGYTPYNSTNPNGYITGNQNITLSGDVTGSGATSIVTTIANNAVTTVKINNGAVTAAKLATFGAGEGIYWAANTDGASIIFESTSDGASGGRALSNLLIALTDNGDEGLKVTTTGAELLYVNINQFQYKGSNVWTAASLTNLNQLTNGPGYITSSGSITGNAATAGSSNFLSLQSTGNLRTISTAGIYREEQPDSGFSYTTTLNMNSSDGRQQLTIERGGGGMKFRGSTSGSGDISWSDWRTVWHSSNLTNLNQLTNGPGYITSYSETDTLASVTGRGSSTSTAVTFNNSVTINGLWSTTISTGGGWNKLSFTATNNWGDGSTYGTLGASGGAEPGVMINNMHATWHTTANGAGIRMGRSGGVSSGAWYQVATMASDEFMIAKTGDWANGGIKILSNGAVNYGNTGYRFVHNNGTWDINITGNAATATSATDSTKLPLAGGTMTGAILMGTGVTAAGNGQPTALSYGLLQGYGTFTLAADTDQSQSEFAIITSGYAIASATAANGLAIGFNTLTWKNNTVYHAGNLTNLNQLSNGPGYITTATNVQGLYLQSIGNASVNVNNGATAVYRNENGNGGNLSYAPVLHLGGSDTMWQIQGDYYSSTDLRWRAGYAGTWYAWRQILHNANYQNYALPLTGGTVTGDVTFGNASNADQGIRILYGNYGGGYGRIRFMQDGSNHSTIHSFSNNWQGGSFIGASAGAINITGSNGVTFGGWNTPDAHINPDAIYIKAWATPSGSTGWNGSAVLRLQQGSSGGNVYLQFRNRADVGDYAGLLFTDNNTGAYIAFRTYDGSGPNDGYNGDYMVYGTYTDHIFQNGASETVDAKTETFRISANGNVRATGDVTAYSDARVKTDIINIDNAISKIQSINGVTFIRTDKEDSKRYAGVIAQEVLNVLPEVVSQDKLGMYSVSYGNMAALFIEAIKEQQKQIEELQKKLDSLIQN